MFKLGSGGLGYYADRHAAGAAAPPANGASAVQQQLAAALKGLDARKLASLFGKQSTSLPPPQQQAQSSVNASMPARRVCAQPRAVVVVLLRFKRKREREMASYAANCFFLFSLFP